MFGLNQAGALRIIATTFRDGDPSYAGSLGGVALGLENYHIFELEEAIPAEVWDREMGFKELEVEETDVTALCSLMREIRQG